MRELSQWTSRVKLLAAFGPKGATAPLEKLFAQVCGKLAPRIPQSNPDEWKQRAQRTVLSKTAQNTSQHSKGAIPETAEPGSGSAVHASRA